MTLALQAAVKRFQSYNGQTPDGVVGESTRTALNVSAAERVNQIVANMERWRWLPDDLGERHVIVNIPGYSLKALDKGEVALRMPVIVGSVERPTPVFSHRITHLVFNPTWTIPPTVARNDILPKLLRNPAYLKEHDIKLFDSWAPGARPIDSRSVNWRDVGSRITRYRMRQDPGPKNSLGRIKYMFPNDFDVYLHDTPARDKFAQVERGLSSGCVRVGDPAALTAFLMEGMDDWPVERRTQVLDAGETKTVWLRQSVPVHLTYQTVYFDEAGKIHFLEDIYGRDDRLRHRPCQAFAGPAGGGADRRLRTAGKAPATARCPKNVTPERSRNPATPVASPVYVNLCLTRPGNARATGLDRLAATIFESPTGCIWNCGYIVSGGAICGMNAIRPFMRLEWVGVRSSDSVPRQRRQRQRRRQPPS